MKLRDEFYRLIGVEQLGEDCCLCHVALNPSSVIYKAHFPGQPVTPGACMLRMVHELTEDVLCGGSPIEMCCVNNLKFLQVLRPTEVTEIDFHLKTKERTPQRLALQAEVRHADTVFSKMSLVFNL